MHRGIALFCVALSLAACTRIADGEALVPAEKGSLYREIQPVEGKLRGRLLTPEEVREVTGLPRLLKVWEPVDGMFGSTSPDHVCGIGYSLAENVQYAGYAAARIEGYSQESDEARMYSVSDALVVFADAAVAQREFRSFSGRISQCDGVTTDTGHEFDSDAWTLRITSADTADEVAWTRSVVDSSWTCYMAARQRTNFVASSMFCTHGSDNKAGDVLDRLTMKLSEAR
ncbi:sensor domain-containing protein [Mycobacteroides salmoniphilum]|uniref:sensor domain-containing protein n=1 Tax=Mycobacteroides salmoniphilum TaxID=404941 RepID=UPI00099234D2|nr:sensor domain-containing protein [Mycobacteroides salmoniphilum]